MAHVKLYRYHDVDLPRKAIAQLQGITETALRNRMQKWGIEAALAETPPLPKPREAVPIRPMLYCPIHELAWTQPLGARPHWRKLHRGTVAWALAWAKAFGCLSQIDIHEVPCQLCEQ